MKKSVCTLTLVIAGLFLVTSVSFAQGLSGRFVVKSVWGHYLQAHKDNGEMHASNDNIGSEETWYIVPVDVAHSIYALQNASNGRYMSKKTNGCAPADSIALTASEKWTFISGVQYGVLNGFAFKAADNTLLGANNAGHDTKCGGEVSAEGGGEPANNSSGRVGGSCTDISP